MSKPLYLAPSFSTSIEQPYAAGQLLDEIGAHVLNTALYDNIKNNLRNKASKIKEAWEKANGGAEWPGLTPEQDAEFKTFAAGYSLAIRASAPTDPIEAEAHRIAKTLVEDRIRAKGASPSHYKEKMPEFIKGVLEKRPDIFEEARRRVEARKEVLSETLDLELL
jgi:hypothetical protein